MHEGPGGPILYEGKRPKPHTCAAFRDGHPVAPKGMRHRKPSHAQPAPDAVRLIQRGGAHDPTWPIAAQVGAPAREKLPVGTTACCAPPDG